MATQTAKASMLIRCPTAWAFDAFVNPEKITQFWLQHTSGPLGPSAEVRWTFMVPGATEAVRVTEFSHGRRIVFEWSDGVAVALDFDPWFDDSAVRVSVEASGLDEINEAEAVVNATEGFGIVLCDLKTWIESGQSANLVKDKALLIAAMK